MTTGSRAEYRIKIQNEVSAVMHAGTRSYVDMYWPTAGCFPVLLLPVIS